MSERTTRGWKVLSTGNTPGAGGTAEEFEQRAQRLARDGHRRLVADLKCLTKVDRSGMAALVRCRDAAQRSGGAFRTAAVPPILFLLMGLGMACGIGALRVAGLGTLFLCVGLVVLDRAVVTKPRTMHVEITATGRDFPAASVGAVFARHGIVVEPREVTRERDARVSYSAAVPPGASLEQAATDIAGRDPRRSRRSRGTRRSAAGCRAQWQGVVPLSANAPPAVGMKSQV